MHLVYYSGRTEYSHRFVESLEVGAFRLPETERLECTQPFILLTPTYADSTGRHAVPKQVVNFLKSRVNVINLRGVIASGNKSFGHTFALAGRLIANKFRVPLLHAFELSGMASDREIVQTKLGAFH